MKQVEGSMIKRELPQIIKDVGFDFSWSEEKVWTLDVPSEEMDIVELTWHFDIPFWSKPGGFYNLTPNEVLKHPDIYKEEFDRIQQSDLAYPLDIMYWKERWLLLDGLHRLVKTASMNRDTVNVRKISKELIPQILK